MSRFDLTFARRLTLIARSPRRPSPLIGLEVRLLETLREAELLHEIGLLRKETDYQIPEERVEQLRFLRAVNDLLQVLSSMSLDAFVGIAWFGATEEQRRTLQGPVDKANEWITALAAMKRAAQQVVNLDGVSDPGTPEQLGALVKFVAQLRNFWVTHTDVAFSDRFKTRDDLPRKPRVPDSAASRFIYRAVKRLDRAYTGSNCASAMSYLPKDRSVTPIDSQVLAFLETYARSDLPFNLESEVSAWIEGRLRLRDEGIGAEKRRARAIRAAGGRR